MNQEENINNQIERNDEFFKVRKELFKGQLKFGAISSIIFILIMVGISFYIPDLETTFITIGFVVYAITCATIWEKKYKLEILNKYDPKYKKITNWN